jgi:hypothetical protein
MSDRFVSLESSGLVERRYRFHNHRGLTCGTYAQLFLTEKLRQDHFRLRYRFVKNGRRSDMERKIQRIAPSTLGCIQDDKLCRN